MFMNDEGNGYQPYPVEYHLSKKPFKYSNKIDTNSLYVFSQEMVNMDGTQPRIVYFYYRFSTVGVATGGLAQLNPILNKYTDGQYCFYRFIDSSTIIVEVYNYDLWNFEYRYFKILDQGLLYYKCNGREFGDYTIKVSNLFVPHKMNFTNPIAFPGDTSKINKKLKVKYKLK
jgi:hypothetical protein